MAQQQVEALSPGNVLNEESPVKNLKGVGEKTVEDLPAKGSTPLREAVEPDPRKSDAIPSTKGAL